MHAIRPFLPYGINVACSTGQSILESIKNSAKNKEELSGWKTAVREYVRWFDGKECLHGVPSPKASEKVISGRGKAKDACMTWNKIFQMKKYLNDLRLISSDFSGKTVLDICSGPHPNALCFTDCEIFGLDHLTNAYRSLGFPMDEYERRYHFIQGTAEKMPFGDSYFDSVISVNGLDHINDFYAAAREIRRVLRPNGKIRFMIEYHEPRVTEPLSLSDSIVENCFAWVINFHKVIATNSDWQWLDQSQPNIGLNANHDGAKTCKEFAVWSNF